MYCHFFFVPNRLLWDNWEEYITGGEDAADPGYTAHQYFHTFNLQTLNQQQIKQYYQDNYPIT